MKRIWLMLGGWMLLFVHTLGGIELIDLKGLNLKLEVSYTQPLLYQIMEGTAFIKEPELSFAVEGEMDKLSLNVELEYPDNLEECYLAFALNDTSSLLAGQFKIPFGYEYNKGSRQRPYPDHALVSQEIAPGYRRGIAFTLDKMLDCLDLTAGLFSGDSANKKKDSLTRLLPAGSLEYSLKLGDIMKLKAGYSGFADLDMVPIFRYALGQSFALQLDINLGKKNDIVLFGEFMERYRNALSVNGNPYWTNGLFAYASWRMKALTPYALWEHFRTNTAAASADDKMAVTGGCSYEPLGDLKINAYYRWEYTYTAGSSTHDVGVICSYRL